MPSAESTARASALRLIRRVDAESASTQSVGSPTQVACFRAYGHLSRSLGSTGAHVLFARALAGIAAERPILEHLSVDLTTEPLFKDLSALVRTHGVDEVDEALSLLLAKVIELLGRLIGDDMVARLLDRPESVAPRDDEDPS